VRRVHLFELEDQPWFPRIVRDLATDYLQFIQTYFRLDDGIAPVIRRIMEGTGERRIVDLCSGGSGPLLLVVKTLAGSGFDVSATLTDLYPNEPTFAEIAAASGGRIQFERQPVDARHVPARLPGVRTLFNGFHHFQPSDARAILHATAAARQPIAIFELSARTPWQLFAVLGTPVGVWIATPFTRPFRWSRLLFTYLLPLVPLTCLWDGVVSQLRAYTIPELQALCEGSAPMRWEAGQIAIKTSYGRLTYLVGVPA
jgi:hypothetical protein